MAEIWKDIKGHDGYQVSNKGRVRSFKKIGCKRGIVEHPNILKPSVSENGRKLVTLTSSKKNKSIRVHRLVAMAFIPNPENKPEVNHIDGNQSNNHIENLEWVTRSENMKHAYKTGLKHITKKQKRLTSLSNRGEGSGSAKLKRNDVLDIRNAYKLGCFTQKEISEAYKLDQGHISDIINKKRWAHL